MNGNRLRSQCKDCIKTKHYRLYGLTPERYREMHAAQLGLCAICGKPEGNGRQLCIDHDHETGQVRQLLCVKCNTGIGQFADDPELVSRALAYLRRHRTPTKEI